MTAGPAAVHVQLRGIRMAFGDVVALGGVDLDVARGEFLSILGPSGCGKTTLINVVAGFLTPAAGAVTIDGEDVTQLPPYRRQLGMVFQSYALFPHMTVAENVGYGLAIRRIARREREERVAAMLDLVKLSGMGMRRPRELSGGQQQRVAIARALALRPRVLLMDEPLSNLDAKLRREMRVELKQLQARIGVTTVFVTHDQEEALTLSDRIAVMSHGRVEQLSSPSEIYRRPANRFVAEFIGQANVFPGTLELSHARDGKTAVVCEGLVIEAAADAAKGGARVVAVVRPERVQVAAAPMAGTNSFSGTVQYALFLGGTRQCGIRLRSGQQITAVVADTAGALPAADDAVWVHWTPEDVVLLPDAWQGAP